MLLYQDKDIIAVNKKIGEYVLPGIKGEPALIDRLEKSYGRLLPVHRIDVPVSGIVLFARTKAAAADLGRQFSGQADKPVEKRYLCAVDAAPPAESGRLEDYLYIPSGKKLNKVRVLKEPGKNTKKAVLDYRLIFRTERYYILEIMLLTGRKHQIRAQLAAAGCHIKGDIKYGAKRTNPDGGIHLHAISLKLASPSSGASLFILAPLPDDPLWNALPPNLLPGE